MNTDLKNNILETLARLLVENKQQIIEANKLDLKTCPTSDAVIFDRLRVDAAKVEKMVASVKNVIAEPDPVGKIISSHTRKDGLKIENRTAAFGTILIIYEARPDVSIEAAIICQKEKVETFKPLNENYRKTAQILLICIGRVWLCRRVLPNKTAA